MKPRVRLIIADDHPIFLRGLIEIIEEDESLYLLRATADGDLAWRTIEELEPEVAVLDISMPKLSGLEIVRKLWELNRPVKLVILTMHRDAQFLDEALNLGVQGFVLKEDAVADLLRCIQRVVQGEMFVSSSLSGLLLKRRHQQERLRTERPAVERLTPAERRVLKLIAEDGSTKTIADQLGVSVRTIDTHRQNICHKLGLQGSHALLKFAYAHRSAL